MLSVPTFLPSTLCKQAPPPARQEAIEPAATPTKSRPKSRNGCKPSAISSNYLTKSIPMFELIRADLNRKTRGFGVRPEHQTFFRKRITPFLEFGTFAVVVYRFGSWAYKVKIPVVRQILIALYLFINVACMAITGIHIARENDIGPGLIIHNFSAIMI